MFSIRTSRASTVATDRSIGLRPTLVALDREFDHHDVWWKWRGLARRSGIEEVQATIDLSPCPRLCGRGPASAAGRGGNRMSFGDAAQVEPGDARLRRVRTQSRNHRRRFRAARAIRVGVARRHALFSGVARENALTEMTQRSRGAFDGGDGSVGRPIDVARLGRARDERCDREASRSRPRQLVDDRLPAACDCEVRRAPSWKIRRVDTADRER